MKTKIGFQPGNKIGLGRPKGVQNSLTQSCKALIQQMIDNNEADKLQEWIDRVAKKNPEKAFYMVAHIIQPAMKNVALDELGNSSLFNTMVEFMNIIKIRVSNEEFLNANRGEVIEVTQIPPNGNN